MTSRMLRSLALSLVACAVLTACSWPVDRTGGDAADPRDQYVGTWLSSSEYADSTLTLRADGSFEVLDFPRGLACGSPSAAAREPEYCRAGGNVSTTGTWTSYRDGPTKVWLRADDRTLAVGFKDLDSFFGHDFSLGFYLGSIDQPEPDYRYGRVASGDGR